jgi:hypothetical protein
VVSDHIGSQILEERLDSLIAFRWGYVGLARPRAPSYQIEVISVTSLPDRLNFTWIVFEDTARPRAVGIRLVDDPFANPRYEVVDYDDQNAFSRSSWRFSARSGWHRLDASPIV